MTKPNYGAEIMGYCLISVSPELLHKFRQEKKRQKEETLYRAFTISSSQQNNVDLLGFGHTLAELPRISLSLLPMHGS